jgi:hypothetical protein
LAGAPAALDFVFDARKYTLNGFPKACDSYVAFHSEKKTRPLFLYGWGIGGNLAMSFDNQDGMRETFEKKVGGSGTVGFNGYSCTLLPDWNTFACAPWLLLKPRPIVYVTVKSLRDFSASDAELRAFFRDDFLNLFGAEGKQVHGPDLDKRGKSAASPSLKAVADVEIKCAGLTTECRDVPLKMTLSGGAGRWTLSFSCEFTFDGKAMGFPGDDAGPVKVHMGTLGYCLIPEKFKDESPKQPGAVSGGVVKDIGDLLEAVE